MALLHGRASSLVFLFFLVAFALSACADDDDGSRIDPDGSRIDSPDNVFHNGGFEDGRDPWVSLRSPEWMLSTEQALRGDSSALLRMTETSAGDEGKIIYLVAHLGESTAPAQLDSALYQDAPTELPQVISGNYYVDKWVRGTKSQYLQFVVVVWPDDPNGLPPCPDGTVCPNYQIRYLLAGVAQDPFPIANAKFVYISIDDPVQGEWVHFERNLREDFEKFWGTIPRDLVNMRVLFEVRYDNKEPNEGPLEADVYYDDLYLGPAASE